ncbi:MAG: pilus (MSHA type) biogenesis protein MshL [Pseudomonadales bacterium]
MPTFKFILLTPVCLLLVSCLNAPREVTPAEGHLGTTAPANPSPDASETASADEAQTPTSIPSLVSVTASVPEPDIEFNESTHTVVVYEVPVAELLFSLARDSELNLDIDPGINSTVSLNAIEQPLTSILNRIAEVADIRYDISGDVLRVRQDLPFIRSYAVDYLNIARSSVGSVAVSTQISSTGQGAGSDSSSENAGNSSDTLVRNIAENAFWETLENNIGRIINRQIDSEGSDDENPDIIVNSESGTLAVRATEREHADIARFLNQVQSSTQRQVMIEATIAEVNLSDTYQAGIDWNLVSPTGTSSVTVDQTLTDIELPSAPNFFNLTLSDLNIGGGNTLQATLSALETFGDVSVMSSPKVMAMNNQTALLKVVDNLVYFTVEVNIDNTGGAVGGGTVTTFETEVNTVPVGFVMSVTPFINETGEVTLNVRPTISRVINFVQDPNPTLAQANVVSQIPVIQVREVESILQVNSGEVAVIGGLMQDEIKNNSRSVPVLSHMPLVGKAFNYDNNETSKTELVIFLRPTVIHKGISSFSDMPTASGSGR